MATPAVVKYHIAKFWDDEFKSLKYTFEPFNNNNDTARWLSAGFSNKFVGDMCDMRSPQPSWNNQFVEFYQQLGWRDIGTSYYRMMPGTVQPTHSDLYVRYVKLFNLQGREDSIRRAIVFLEDWKPGHYGEHNGVPFVEWSAGDVVEWTYDTEHMAANCGFEPRYTLQITGTYDKLTQ
jgi:hypothetical protein